MKSFLLAAAGAALLVAGAASAASELAPAVQAGFDLKFGGSRGTAHDASLSFAAGYAVRDERLWSPEAATSNGAERMRRPGVLPVFDGRISEARGASFLRAAGFALAKPGATGAHANGTSAESGWWGRNWWWVALTGVAAGTVAALAGGGIENNGNNGVNVNGTPTDGGGDGGGNSCPADCTCVGVSSVCSDIVGR